MEYKDLKNQTIEQMVGQVQGWASVATQDQMRSAAALAGRVALELSGGMEALATGMGDVKKSLAERLSTLSDNIDGLKAELMTASAQSSAQTQALVHWTKIQVVATILYTLITGGLLIVAIRH